VPDLRKSETLFVGSDYGGEHNGAPFRTLSFLVTDNLSTPTWMAATRIIRQHILGRQQRKISYKDLNDGVVRRYLPSFLESAYVLNGLLLTLAIDKRVTYVAPETREMASKQAPNGMSRRTLEKALRVAHMIGVLVSGLSRAGQDVYWVTDNDDIVANDRFTEWMIEAVAGITGVYLPHTMGELRCATSGSSRSDLVVEDFLAIPDVVSGCLSDVLAHNPPNTASPNCNVIEPLKGELSDKAKQVLGWYVDEAQPLKRLLIEVCPGDADQPFAVCFRKVVRTGVSRCPHVMRAYAVSRDNAAIWRIWRP